MATEIEQDAYRILEFAVHRQDEARATDVDQVDEYFAGADIQEATGLPPGRINDAVGLLRQNDFLEGFDYFGTRPFEFGQTRLTSLGRFEYQRLSSATAPESGNAVPSVERLPVPIGSPFGFTDLDWEHVSSERGKTGQLRVVLGYQFESPHYDAERLVVNLRSHFDTALAIYNERSRGNPSVQLVFEPLSAGLGEHLFNDIVRAIISADVAVFETSDLNPNVMIELGVALTWGTRVLPVKQHERPRPPSDISGQTWADYEESGNQFVDPEFGPKLVALVERAHRKKLAVGTPVTD
jgi:hypothetical protein